jgi:hypothetical protein
LDQEPDETGHPAGPAGYGILFESRPLVIFGLCVMLFHFANAPLLPLVGQKLAGAYPQEATAMMSSCIVAAQLVMLPIALLVGRTADSWGRKPLFLAGFAILPIRAVLYTLSDNRFWLVGVQLLDGGGAGIFGALTPLVIADIMRGTGRYNLALGAIATAQDGPRHRRLAQWVGGRRDRRSLWIQRRLSRVGRGRRRGPDRLRAWDARNSRPGGGIAAVLRRCWPSRKRRLPWVAVGHSSTNGLWSAVLRITAGQASRAARRTKMGNAAACNNAEVRTTATSERS